MPQRIALRLRYDGTRFSGSQIQPGRRTVAGTLKTELESLLGAGVHLQFAGRTDSGVHANGNVCAFDAEIPLPLTRIPAVLNARLPEDLLVREAWETSASFHPRFDALRREYRYRVSLGSDAGVEQWRFQAPYSGHWDPLRVRKALAVFSGEHCFNSFCAGSLARDKSRCRIKATLHESGAQQAELHYVGDRFLRNMICRLTAAVLLYSASRVTLVDLRAALAGNRTFQLKPALPQGLVLEDVYYANEAN